MKCPNCNGVPYDEVWTCEVCNGKGIVEPLTEQEYLQTCSIEQLAEFLLHIADSCYWAGFFKGKDDDDGYDDEYCLINQNIVEWLKQPHTDS